MSQIPFDAIRTWMFQEALPYWAAHGLDKQYGGFLEELTPGGETTDVGFKRLRVTCRQIYVFSHAALLGWSEGEALAKRGFDYLINKAWLGPERGWAKLLSRQGAVIDPTPELYDIAFVLFALAWRYRQSRDPEALRYAHATLDFVQTHMRGPHAGFWQQVPPQGPRVQNPHMHLFEASIAAFEATAEPRFLDQAREIAALFRDHFFDGHTLGEYFTEDWRRLAGDEGHRVEPGHQFEWAWILARYAALTGEDVTGAAETLVGFADRYGVDPASHATFDEIRDDGTPLRTSSRTWPNTERIKGHLALFELTGRDPRAAVSESVRLLLDRYLAVPQRGAWIDQFDAQGTPMVTAAPASTFYHVFLAFAETLRLEARLSALP